MKGVKLMFSPRTDNNLRWSINLRHSLNSRRHLLNRSPRRNFFRPIAQHDQNQSIQSTQRSYNSREVRAGLPSSRSASDHVTTSRQLMSKGTGTCPFSLESSTAFNNLFSYIKAHQITHHLILLPSKQSHTWIFATILREARPLT